MCNATGWDVAPETAIDDPGMFAELQMGADRSSFEITLVLEPPTADGEQNATAAASRRRQLQLQHILQTKHLRKTQVRAATEPPNGLVVPHVS